MKSVIAAWWAVFLLTNFSIAQIRLGPSGGCGVTKEGARDCSWASAINIRKPSAEAAARQRSIAIRTRQYPTTQNNFAPGAPFDAGSADYDRILVALTDTHLVNEATKQDFLLSSGSTLLLSKGEKYVKKCWREKRHCSCDTHWAINNITPKTRSGLSRRSSGADSSALFARR